MNDEFKRFGGPIVQVWENETFLLRDDLGIRTGVSVFKNYEQGYSLFQLTKEGYIRVAVFAGDPSWTLEQHLNWTIEQAEEFIKESKKNNE